jgi:hypothetical protein
MGNVFFSYILPNPFNSDRIDDKNYLLGRLWPYLVGLFEAPNTCSYVGSHHHGHKQVTKNSLHWKFVRTYAWLPTL